MNQNLKYDFLVIGAGSGGIRAARVAAQLGARVAIVEAKHLGGTCVNVGCVPKKLLCYAAEFGTAFTEAAGYGWTADGPRFSWPQLIANKNRAIARLNNLYERMLNDAGVHLLRGHARFIAPHSVSVAEAVIQADHVLIATGGRPVIPNIPGSEHGITSDDAFFLARLPERPIVVGGGYIAVEFTSIFHGLGATPRLLHRGPMFLREFDDDTRAFLAHEMRKKGIELHFDATLARIEGSAPDYRLILGDGKTLSADCILFATGRKANTAGLGVETLGLALDASGGVVVDDHYRTNIEGVYAIGDVTQRIQLTPVAIAEGMTLARNLFGGQACRLAYEYVPTTVFSAPNLGTVGLTEAAARTHYGDIAVYKKDFAPLKHALSGTGERAFMKLVVDRASDRVVGAHMVGADAGEIIQGLAVAMKAGATKAMFDATIGIHPTAAEEFVTMRVAEPRNNG